MFFRFALAIFLFAALPAEAAPQVLATIKPVHSLVAAVMGDAGSPALLIGGSLLEHDFALSPVDARKIERARLIFQIGPEFESNLVRPLAGRNTKLVSLSRAPGVRLLPARKGELWDDDPANQTDPHIWLDPENAIAMVRAIQAALSKADPSGAELYARNAAREVFLLMGLENRMSALMAPLKGKPYIVFHDAYRYFESRFGLTPIGAVTTAPDRPVGQRRMTDLRNAIDRQHVACIFREPQFSPSLIAPLTAGHHINLSTLDPFGADLTPGPELYGLVMERLALSLRQCLAAPQKKA